jgi:hypothetical protein
VVACWDCLIAIIDREENCRERRGASVPTHHTQVERPNETGAFPPFMVVAGENKEEWLVIESFHVADN